MTDRNWRLQAVTGWLVPLVATTLFVGTASAYAQTIGPDEAVNANGAVSQQFALTQAQKTAIYNAVLQQQVRTSTTHIRAAVGAPVSPMAELAELPDQAAGHAPLAADLKYAMVEDDVVIVDPIRMRVVDIIHRGTRP
jgi:uncharacterized protein DUF1236